MIFGKDTLSKHSFKLTWLKDVAPSTEAMEPMVNGTAEQFISALGEAVVRVWSRLPQDV
jgi:hypothetical protein